MQETWGDPIAFQFSVMNTILVCVTIILATMAFIGFNTLKTHAGHIAKEAADSYLRELKHREGAKERENPSPLEQAVKENQIKPEENL